MAMVGKTILGLSWQKVPIVLPLSAYCIGIVVGGYINFFSSNWILVSIIIFFILLLIFWVIKSLIRYFSIFLILFFIAFGYYSAIKYDPNQNYNYFAINDSYGYIGIIDEEPIQRQKTVRLFVHVVQTTDSNKQESVKGRLVLTVKKDSIHRVDFRYGDKIAFVNKVHPVNPPFNPNEFDYKSYLAHKNIWYQCFLNREEIKILDQNKGNVLVGYSLKLREKLIHKFRKYITDDEAYQIAIALVLGSRSEISEETISAFTNTGTIHVLSVSGLHVSLVFALLTFLLKFLDRFRFGRHFRSILILLAIWFYVILTGMSPPILRAGIMITFFTLSLAFSRKQVPLNTLLFSAFFILLFSPKSLFDVGFQLSYLAIGGIILCFPILKYFYLPKNSYLRSVVEYCYVSISAQLFTMPLVLYYFGQFPTYFLFANLFIAIPSSLIMYVGVFLVFSPFNFLSYWLGELLNFLLIFLIDGLKVFEHLPIPVLSSLQINLMGAVLLLLIILLVIFALSNRSKILLKIVSILCIALICYYHVERLKNQSYKGYKIYNVRNEVAIAYICNGNVNLFSSLDSLNHNTLQYHVLPDLLSYVSLGKIQLHPLSLNNKDNVEIEVGDKNMLLVQSNLEQTNQEYDIILCRRNYRDIVNHSVNAKVIVFDGSNSDAFIQEKSQLSSLKSSIPYILKNNFAYVWEED